MKDTTHRLPLSNTNPTIHTLISIISIIIIFFASFPLQVYAISIEYENMYGQQDLFEGYTLFAPEYHTDTFLLSNDQEIVHTWYGNMIQAMAVYLLDNGNIVRTSFPTNTINSFLAGGRTGRVELLDWNSNVIWEFEYSNDEHCLHHDIEVLPNGNILMIAWEAHTKQEGIQQGRNPALIQTDEIWTDHIIEVKPTGKTGFDIVWEWHVWDHLVQDYDQSKPNYGIISDHPELIDFNHDTEGGKMDWNHINSIDYHEKLDQILLSVNGQKEIWIIDHSTTTEEAAGHMGGRYGKGGDLLYRWGNPQVYDQGTIDDQTLFSQHDANWIPSGYPGEGNILIFNNGVKRPDGVYSSIEEIIPPITISGQYRYNDEAYGPETPVWTYSDGPGFFSTILSSAQRLPNGNTLICEGVSGRIFEVTLEKEKIWEYTNQFGLQKSVFRALKYPLDHPGIQSEFKPQTPQNPNGPSIGVKGKTYIYETTGYDPNGEELYFQWDFGNGSYSNWSGPHLSNEMVNYSYNWKDNGFQKIRVRAKNTAGFTSDWSTKQVYISKIKLFPEHTFSFIYFILSFLTQKDLS